jgi:hypothetical protein
MTKCIILAGVVDGMTVVAVLLGVAGSGLAAEPGKAVSKPSATADFQPQALWDGRNVVPFRALDLPKMVKAQEADFLADNDYVLGVTAGGESRAYPTRFIWWHHVINDAIGRAESGKQQIAVTYCSVCNTGIRYDLQREGGPIKLDFYGLYNGVVALCERDGGSVFRQVDGRFVTGPLQGQALKPEPVLDTTWGQWKQLHPDTLVMSPQTAHEKNYSPRDKPEPRGYDRFPAPFFAPTVTRADKRLPFFEKVLGLTVPAVTNGAAARRAYPIKALREAGGPVNDTLGGQAVAVFFDPESVAAVAVSRVVSGRSLTFEQRKQAGGEPAIFDKETGTRWDIEGHGEEGPMKGKELTRLDSHLSQWYGWVAYFPDTGVYGREGPPEPADPAEVVKAKP